MLRTAPYGLRRDIDHAAFAAEYARDLLDSMHNDPEFNATWGLFWSTQARAAAGRCCHHRRRCCCYCRHLLACALAVCMA